MSAELYSLIDGDLQDVYRLAVVVFHPIWSDPGGDGEISDGPVGGDGGPENTVHIVRPNVQSEVSINCCNEITITLH